MAMLCEDLMKRNYTQKGIIGTHIEIFQKVQLQDSSLRVPVPVGMQCRKRKKGHQFSYLETQTPLHTEDFGRRG